MAHTACEILRLSGRVAVPVDPTAPKAPLQFERQGTHGRRHPRPCAESSPSVLARLSGEENSASAMTRAATKLVAADKLERPWIGECSQPPFRGSRTTTEGG